MHLGGLELDVNANETVMRLNIAGSTVSAASNCKALEAGFMSMLITRPQANCGYFSCLQQ